LVGAGDCIIRGRRGQPLIPVNSCDQGDDKMPGVPEIRSVRPDETQRLAATLTLAFADDPSVRWGLADAGQYILGMGPYASAFGGKAALERGTAYVVGDFLGVAVFLQPNARPDEEAMAAVAMNYVPAAHLAEVHALLETMAQHQPAVPHWHLTLIGIDPAHRGRGLGTALLRHGLTICDQAPALAYLEATSPRNLSLYERHGFEVIAEIAVGSSPPMYPMIRKPR
jgi:ribosomal protein S18 acetylase RimI-like enzyme